MTGRTLFISRLKPSGLSGCRNHVAFHFFDQALANNLQRLCRPLLIILVCMQRFNNTLFFNIVDNVFERTRSIQSGFGWLTEPDPDPEDTTPIPTDAPPTLTVTPATIDMDMVAIGETGEKLLRVENTGGGILIVSLILSGDASFNPSPLGTVNLGAGHTRWITIRFSPTAEGAGSASLALTSSVGDVEAGLTGSGFEPALNASTSAIDFGQVETGASATATFQLTNPGTETVSSVAVSTPASPFTVDVPDVSGGIGAGVSIDILVVFEPTTVGTFTTDFVITWQDGQSTTIRLDGEGLPPPLALELLVLEVDFGDVEIGGMPGMDSITLTNPNSGALQGISASDPGAPFVSSQPAVTELGFGESVDFSVGFEPRRWV